MIRTAFLRIFALHLVLAICAPFCASSAEPTIVMSTTPSTGVSSSQTVEGLPCASEWLISTRHLPDARRACASPESFHYQRRDGQRWTTADWASFHATDHAQAITCIFVHGNRMEDEDAYRHGALLYRQLTRSSQSFRLVVWSWPSDRVHGPVRDVKLKAARADSEAHYLSQFIRALPPDQPMTLIGYSFGARAVAGSLQLLAGGSVPMIGGAPQSVAPHRPRVVLMAAAFPACWLHGRGPFHQAVGQAQSFASFYNPQDPALRIYRLAATKEHAPLLGGQHAVVRTAGDAATPFEQFDVSSMIGATHDFDDYMNTPRIMNSIRPRALHLDAPQ